MDRPLLLRRLFLVLFSVLVLAACWLTPVDRYAREQVTAGLQRSLTAFAAARTLGAAVSVVQSVRVEAVVGVSPGEALRPLSELIDRFAAVMLAASVAFGVQLLLLGVGGHVAVSAALTGVLLAWALIRWRGDAPSEPATRTPAQAVASARSRTLRWLTPALIGLLMARFAVPLSAVANEAAYRAVMAGEFQDAMAGLEGASAKAEAAVAEPAGASEASKGAVERMRAWVERLKSTPAAIDALLQSAKEWATQIVRLMAVFVLQTAVLPLAFLWLFWRLARGLVGMPAR